MYIEIENFQKAALFAFDPKTGNLLTYTGGKPGWTRGAHRRPDQQNFSWSLPNRRMDIYAIVNYGDLDLASYARPGLKKAELEALRFTSRNPSELKRLETEGYGMPMAGVKEGVFLTSPGDGLEIPVKKLYAKYNLWFDLSRIEQEGWHVQAMHIIVENANTEVPYFVENYRQDDPSKLVEYDRATEQDLDEIQQGGSGHAVTLYMLENCQGIKEGAESWKTVYKDLGFEALRNCTYIDLSVKVNRRWRGIPEPGVCDLPGEDGHALGLRHRPEPVQDHPDRPARAGRPEPGVAFLQVLRDGIPQRHARGKHRPVLRDESPAGGHFRLLQPFRPSFRDIHLVRGR